MPRARTYLIRRAVGGALVVFGSFAVSLWVMDSLWPSADNRDRPALAQSASLPELARASVVIAPAVIALSAIRDAMERAAPRDLTGARDNPLSEILGKADIGWTAARGPLAVPVGVDGW